MEKNTPKNTKSSKDSEKDALVSEEKTQDDFVGAEAQQNPVAFETDPNVSGFFKEKPETQENFNESLNINNNIQNMTQSTGNPNNLQKPDITKVAYPTPYKENVNEFKGFSFGLADSQNGKRTATSMSIFISDGTRSISLTPAKYFSIKKEIESLQAQQLTSAIVEISNSRSGTLGSDATNTFVKYAKINLLPDATKKLGLSIADKPRVLLCQLVRTSKNSTDFVNKEIYGICIALNNFDEISFKIHSNNKSIETLSDPDF